MKTGTTVPKTSGYFDLYRQNYGDKPSPQIDPLTVAHIEDMDDYTFLRQEQERWNTRRENR